MILKPTDYVLWLFAFVIGGAGIVLTVIGYPLVGGPVVIICGLSLSLSGTRLKRRLQRVRGRATAGKGR
jgi:hypothetical protein